MIIIQKKSFYEKYDTELKVPPILKVQIWDNDSFSADDFLATMYLNLSYCPVPAETAKKCRVKKKLKRMNLFNMKKIRGWFPVYGTVNTNNGSISQAVRNDRRCVSSKFDCYLFFF